MVLDIALSEIGRFLLVNDMDVMLVVFDDTSFQLSHKITKDIDELIDSQAVASIEEAEYDWEKEWAHIRKSRKINDHERYLQNHDTEVSLSDIVIGNSLEEIVNSADDGFKEYLFKLIDERKLTDVTIYKRANIDRRLFSQIRCKKNYKPKKITAVALAIALRLDMATLLKLLSKAGLTLSSSDRFDLIISYFVRNKIYDIDQINAALFKYNQPQLGIAE